jgi:hypothetical protein
MLEDTKPIANRLGDFAAQLELNWRTISLPDKLRMMFVNLWVSQIGHGAELAPSVVKLFTSDVKAEYVPDILLAKAIAAYPLRKALHSYKEMAISLADTAGITTFKDEFKDQRDTPPPSWSLWEAALRASSMTMEEKSRLSMFLCDSTAFHDIKGISRGDFAQPAICKTIGHRVERFGIADQIAEATNQALYDAVVECVTSRLASVTRAGEIGILSKQFESALVDTGFQID